MCGGHVLISGSVFVQKKIVIRIDIVVDYQCSALLSKDLSLFLSALRRNHID
jgi:hypothetical protein